MHACARPNVTLACEKMRGETAHHGDASQQVSSQALLEELKVVVALIQEIVELWFPIGIYEDTSE